MRLEHFVTLSGAISRVTEPQAAPDRPLYIHQLEHELTYSRYGHCDSRGGYRRSAVVW